MSLDGTRRGRSWKRKEGTNEKRIRRERKGGEEAYGYVSGMWRVSYT